MWIMLYGYDAVNTEVITNKKTENNKDMFKAMNKELDKGSKNKRCTSSQIV